MRSVQEIPQRTIFKNRMLGDRCFLAARSIHTRTAKIAQCKFEWDRMVRHDWPLAVKLLVGAREPRDRNGQRDLRGPADTLMDVHTRYRGTS